MYGKYLYGIITGGSDTALGVRGLVGANLVHNIAHDGLSCVASDYTGGNFDIMSREELAQYLVTHQTVIEQVAKRHPILPFKFGTVLADSDEVHRLLAQGHPQFSLTLFWMQDKVEVEVMASWAGGQIFEENVTGSEKLHADAPLPPGQINLSPPQSRQSYLERMVGFLKPVSVDVQPHTPGSGGMAMSVAFLVEKASLETFHERIKHLNALFYNQIDFQVIGSLPPYSFATVEVNRYSQEAIDEAKRLLKLNGLSDEVEVRKAYRHMALEFNSGGRPGDKLTKTRLTALQRASDLLVAYCRGQAEKEGDFLISIRRSRGDEVQPPRLVKIGA
jgi:hypothetical protein